MTETKTHYCGFCGKSNVEVRFIIEGRNACICDECIEGCAEIIKEQKEKQNDIHTQTPYLSS